MPHRYSWTSSNSYRVPFYNGQLSTNSSHFPLFPSCHYREAWLYLSFVLPFSGSLRLDEPLNPPSPARNNHIHGSLQLAGHSKLRRTCNEINCGWKCRICDSTSKQQLYVYCTVHVCTSKLRNRVASVLFFLCCGVDLNLLSIANLQLITGVALSSQLKIKPCSVCPKGFQSHLVLTWFTCRLVNEFVCE